MTHQKAIDQDKTAFDPAKHVVLDGEWFALVDERGKPMLRERMVQVNGQRYEHVSELPSGAWVYRSM